MHWDLKRWRRLFDHFNRHNAKPINQLSEDCVLVEFHRSIFTKYDHNDGDDEEENKNASTRVWKGIDFRLRVDHIHHSIDFHNWETINQKWLQQTEFCVLLADKWSLCGSGGESSMSLLKKNWIVSKLSSSYEAEIPTGVQLKIINN